MIAQVEIDQLVRLNISDWHESTINANSFSIDLADKFGQVLQAELVHILVAEVHHSVRVGRVKHLTG